MLTISYILLVAICLIALMTVMTVFGILSISNSITPPLRTGLVGDDKIPNGCLALSIGDITDTTLFL